MPPANSPVTNSSNSITNGRSTTTPPPTTAPQPSDPLSYLSSPVPDLASTLYTHAADEADEADEANVTFLRDSLDAMGHDAQPPRSRSQTQIDPIRDPRRAASATNQSRGTSSESLEDLSRRERLRSVLARLNRMQDPASGSSATAYSNRTPSPTRQRLYDWAPSHNESAQQEDHELDSTLAMLRRQQPETHSGILHALSQNQSGSSRQSGRDAVALPPAADLTDAADRRERLRERRRRESEWVSLRSRAVMQRARQEGSPSATERMLRYVMERERSGISEEEERARNAGWFNPGNTRLSGEQQRRGGTSSREPWPLPPSTAELHARTMQGSVDTMQRRYLAENPLPPVPRLSTSPIPATSSPSNSSQFLENAIKYLNSLRSCYGNEDALSAAMDHGLATKEFFADKHDDFIMDVSEMNPLAGSSWLQPCSTFDGHQHAMNSNPGLLRSRPAGASSHAVEQINPNFRSLGSSATSFDHPPGSTQVQPFNSSRSWLSHPFPSPLHSAAADSAKAADPNHDHWPVRVIIHSINPEKMTLQGTMEAYDVPQHPASVSVLNTYERPKAGKKHAPITTYLEGHIIDIATHSFLTPSATEAKQAGPHPTSIENSTPYTTLSDSISFPSANAHTDASNWRKLPPFNEISSDELTAHCLLSKGRMNDILEKYIFMRWKERCFVHSKDDKCSAVDRASDQDRGHGLTISGFYYVSLRRSDGLVEGLYFDPSSTPYQHLRLRGHQDGWPAFEFR